MPNRSKQSFHHHAKEAKLATISTLHGTIIKVPVYLGMPIVDFKKLCIEACPFHVTPLSINVDLAQMMHDGTALDPLDPSKNLGWRNGITISTNEGQVLDEDVSMTTLLMDATLFKVMYIKQYN